MTRIIAFANQKGGVGKTTTAVNLGAALTERGKKVLLLDFDPQGSLTKYLGIQLRPGEPATEHLLLSPEVTLVDVIRTTPFGLDAVPATRHLAVSRTVLRQGDVPWQFSLARKVRRSSHPYDFLLIDCPPELGELSMMALVAAHEVIIVTQCDMAVWDGMQELHQTLLTARDEMLNPALKLLGILINMYDARLIHDQRMLQIIAAAYPGALFRTIIKRTVRYRDSYAAQQPITIFDRHSEAAEAYRRLAQEVLNGQ
ncbi:MAG: ParA family protein [Chloroflexi bacterium]|nr:ParA family protein [Chloroflexota bacterium]